jgi:hypothetical protein
MIIRVLVSVKVCRQGQEITQECGTQKVLHSGKLQTYQQTLDSVGKICRDKHSSLLRTLINYGRKSFTTIGPGVNPMEIFLV